MRLTGLGAYLTSLLLLPAGGAWAADSSKEDLAVEKALKSVYLVTTEKSVGSGFALAGGLFVTNFHVVEGSCTLSVVRPDGLRMSPVGFLAANKENDFVILKLDIQDLPPLPLGDSDTLRVGQPIYAVGFPQVGSLAALGSIESALVPSLSDGIISGRRRMAGADTLQVSAPISPGSSGGPIINAGSQVVGIATFALREGQNMNFAVPSAYLKPFLKLPVKPIAEAPWCRASPGIGSPSSAESTGQEKSGSWSICMVVERGKKADMWCYPTQEQCRDAERQTREDQAWKIAASCHPARD